MNRFLKVLKISLLTFIILLFSLVVTGWLLQDRITKYALNELSETFDAPMATQDVNFSLITDFPLASIQFKGLWLGAYQWNEKNEIQSIDTLVRVNNLYVSVNTRDLLNDIFTIRKVELEGAFVKYEIDSLGGTNFDFLMTSDTVAVEEEVVEGEPLDLTAEGIRLSSFTLLYKDEQQGIETKAYIPEINGAVKLKDPKTYAHFNGNLVISDVFVKDTPMDRMEKADLGINLTFKSDTLEIASLVLQTEEIKITSNGKVILGEQTYADLNTTIKAPSLAKLTKYAPDGMLKANGVSQIAGSLDINSSIRGIVGEEDLPHYEVTLNYDQGSLKYENYPLVYNIGIQTSITNGAKNNNSTTAINLSQLKANISGSQINLSGKFSNLDQLKYDLKAGLDLDFDASNKIIPDSLAQKAGGQIKVQLATKGIAPDSVDNQFVADALSNTTAKINFQQFDLLMKDAINLKALSGEIAYANRTIRVSDVSASLPDYKVDLAKNNLEMNFSGDVMQPESMDINIPNFHLATTEASIHGSATIEKMKHLTFATNTQLNLNLNKAKRFTSDTLVNDMNGLLKASIQSKGKLDIEKMADEDIETILYDNTNLDLTLERINLDMKDTLMNVKNLSGRITKKEHHISIDGFKGGYQGISFDITTTIENAINTALRNKPGTLKVDGTYKLGDLDNKILGAFASEDEAQDTPSSREIEEPTNWNYEVTGQAFVKSFKYDDTTVKDIETVYDINDANQLIKSTVKVGQTIYGKTATINNLSTKLEMNMSNNEVKGKLAITDMKYEDAILKDISALYNVNDSVYTVDQLDFMGFGGEIISSMQVHMKPEDEMEIEMKSNIVELDVRRLMKEMKNFDQKEMTYEQLNGIVSSDNFFLRMVMIGDSIVYDDMRMTCDLKFHDGGIYHYPPVQILANDIPKIDNLDTLSFKTIDTHMFLFKDAVYVPRTYVVSSLFDIDILGMQKFNEDYHYHVGVNLGQVMGRKKASSLDDNSETKKKKMIRVKATGHQGEYKTKIDSPKARDDMKTKVKTQEKVLQFRFQPKAFSFETGAENL
ncbi:AsmA family protein [Reichenbachiella sp.]|uniref:AsmA family protein n=1 Tax=Reichenbachiella sp. TaxID=2184521 RepID=UPI003BB09961